MKKPKAADFKIGQPITDEEREAVLRTILDNAVERARENRFFAAIDRWDYENGRGR